MTSAGASAWLVCVICQDVYLSAAATLTVLPWAAADDVDDAVASARSAFRDGPWARLHPRERGELMVEFARIIDAHRSELALLVALEMGKPVRAAYEI